MSETERDEGLEGAVDRDDAEASAAVEAVEVDESTEETEFTEGTETAGSSETAGSTAGADGTEIEESSPETGAEPDEGAGAGNEQVARLEREGDIAADYLEELLDIADLDGDLDMDVDGDRAAVSIVGADLSQLVGRNGEVLDALQELTRLAVYRETGERSRLMLDVSGHRAARRAALVVVAEAAVNRVKESGEPESLDPMTPFERKIVHDTVAAGGLSSESEGTEPRRFVVVLPG